MNDQGKCIADLTHQVMVNQMIAWERVLRLHIKPKPRWCPRRLWHRLIRLMVVQTESPMETTTTKINT